MRGLLQDSRSGRTRVHLQDIRGPRIIPEVTKEDRILLRKWEMGEYTFPPLMVTPEYAVLLTPAEDPKVVENIKLWRMVSLATASTVAVQLVDLSPTEERTNQAAMNRADRDAQNFLNPGAPQGGRRYPDDLEEDPPEPAEPLDEDEARFL